MLSLLTDPSLVYPDANDFYSPDERYPEYRHERISSQKNPVYRAVRECFAQAGLDRDHFDTPGWNPLGDHIHPGDKVFVLCNFANERRSNELIQDYWSRCTHGSVIRATIDYILIATGGTGRIYFGNAPTQFCHWQAVLADTGAQAVLEFYNTRGVPVLAKDLRLYVTDATRLGKVKGVERRDETDGVPVNLGNRSMLAELDREKTQRYRVKNYNPSRTDAFHAQGSHTFVINRHILDSDVIFSIPKFKTHEKVGISCALKGFVGTVGHKDSLPHHRRGTPEQGGDEYPSDKTGLLRMATAFHEQIQQTKPDTPLGSLLRVNDRVVRRLVRPVAPVSEGAWWGNNTAWRMALDLVRIATYASPDGEMGTTPRRRQLVLIDGILGGEGEGPAEPTAVPSGFLQFGDNLVAVDYLNALLMGFDPEKIPLVREAFHVSQYPILNRGLTEEAIIHNGHPTTIEELLQIERHPFEPPMGWKGKMEAAINPREKMAG